MLHTFSVSSTAMRRAGAAFALAVAACALFTPADAADIRVGPTRYVRTLAAAVASARPNDRILLDPGTYWNDTAAVNVPLTIEGYGGVATLQVNQNIANGKGILVVNNNLTVRNVKFAGARVTSANGAGIRHQWGQLIIDNCAFENNQNGILANPEPTATITITNSYFNANGSGDGYTHAIYANAIGHLYVSDSTFTGTRVGHDIKSRALQTTVRNSTLDDGVDGNPSYAIDLPNGGEVFIEGVRVNQGPNTSNPIMIAYGAEGNLHWGSWFTLRNSALVNTRSGGSTGVRNFSGIYATVETNSTFSGVAAPLSGYGGP